MKEKIKLLAIVWTVGLLGGILFWLLRITARIKLSSYWQLVKLIIRMILGKEKRGLVLYFRHTSLYDPAPLPFLFFPFYLFSLRLIPYSLPDKKNYYNKFWFFFFRPVCIPIERESPRKVLKIFQEEIKPKLENGGIVILAPEGGRTFKGEEWKIIKGGEIEITKSWDEGTKIIRRFQLGISRLALDAKAIFLPVWTEGGEKIILNQPAFSRFRFWQQLSIKIGQPIEINKNLSRREVIELLENHLLRLGEE